MHLFTATDYEGEIGEGGKELKGGPKKIGRKRKSGGEEERLFRGVGGEEGGLFPEGGVGGRDFKGMEILPF